MDMFVFCLRKPEHRSGDMDNTEETDCCGGIPIEETTMSSASETVPSDHHCLHDPVLRCCSPSSLDPHYFPYPSLNAPSLSLSHIVPASSSTVTNPSTDCSDNTPPCQHRKRSPTCQRSRRVPRAGLWLLMLMSCVGVALARPSSSSLYRQDRRVRDVQSDAVRYLAQFGYLTGPSRETGNLMSAEHLARAIRSLQAMGGINQTGVIDRQTQELMRKPRCGNLDSTMGVIPGRGRSDLGPGVEGRRKRRRYRRYTEAPTKWHRKRLTFRLLNHSLELDATEVRRTIKSAFSVWSKATQLQFVEVDKGQADIMIQFASRYHSDGYPFDGKGMILAHAFFPGAGRGGDTHFDSDEMWTLNATEGVDLFMVAAHEFGHALGLAHSADPNALMYPWYQGFSGKFALPRDDTEGIQKLYGLPNGVRDFPVRPREEDNADVTPRYRGGHDDYPNVGDEQPPDPCTTPFDAITIIRNVVFLFIGKWFWRLDSKNVAQDPVHLHKFWYGLPSYVTKIDAVFENPVNKRIIFFSGKRYWLFNANQMVSGFRKEGEPITDFGIPSDVDHIDTVFTWGLNKRTYLVSGDMYWKLFENNTHVEFDYPRDMSIWRGVKVPLDAAFKYSDDKLYFFQGKSYWKFYDPKMRVEKSYPRRIAKDWLQCDTRSSPKDPAEHRTDQGHNAAPAHQYLVSCWLSILLSGLLIICDLQI